MDIGVEANFLQFRQLIRRQDIVEVLSHLVGIRPDTGSRGGRSGQPSSSADRLDSSNEFLRALTFTDFLTNLLDLVGLQSVIQVGK
jgi:hypothetical protein